MFVKTGALADEASGIKGSDLLMTGSYTNVLSTLAFKGFQ